MEKKEKVTHKTVPSGVPSWQSRVRIWWCHCCGSGSSRGVVSIPGLELPHGIGTANNDNSNNNNNKGGKKKESLNLSL